VTKFNILNRWH